MQWHSRSMQDGIDLPFQAFGRRGIHRRKLKPLAVCLVQDSSSMTDPGPGISF